VLIITVKINCQEFFQPELFRSSLRERNTIARFVISPKTQNGHICKPFWVRGFNPFIKAMAAKMDIRFSKIIPQIKAYLNCFSPKKNIPNQTRHIT